MATRAARRGERGHAGFSFREAMRSEILHRREVADDAALSMREFGEAVPEPGPRPLDFNLFPSHAEWYSEEVARAEEVVFKKSSQVGASAYMWRWAARQAEQLGNKVLYIFPTNDHVYDFGDERIEPAIDDSPLLRRRMGVGKTRSKRLKRIGNGYLYLRGSQSKAGAQSVAAQAIVFDEYDLLDPQNLPQIERRIAGARGQGETPRVRRLGNPTLPGYGIAAAYKHTDRREWHVRCPSCDHEQPMSFEDTLRWTVPGSEGVCRAGHDAYVEDADLVDAVWRACRRCDATLEGQPLREGRWIAQNPGARVLGFHANRFAVPLTDLRAIVVASRATKPAEIETFHQNDLGLEYSPAEAGLDRDAIEAAMTEGLELRGGYVGKLPVTMGVDVASERNLTVRISEQQPDGRRAAIYIGEVESFTEVDKLMRDFRVTMCAVDHLPESSQARALRATHPGRVVLVAYDHRYTSEPMTMKLDANNTPYKVTVNRTLAIDSMMDAVRQRRNVPLRQAPPKYMDHMTALKRRTAINTKGEPERAYVTTGGKGDDYAHAEVFDLVATELWRARERVAVLRSEAEGSHVPDERLGFRRLGLDAETGDPTDYRGGFGE